MKAAVLKAFGSPLVVETVPAPVLGTGEVIVDVAARDADHLHLYVEGPTPDWSLPLPKLVDHGTSDLKRFTFALDGLPSGTKPDGAALKFTLADGHRAYEFNVNPQ